jgi:hypothetical protein
MSGRFTRDWLDVGAVLCAVIVGILTNLVTGRWNIGLGVGLGGTVVCWIAIELLRITREPAQTTVTDVKQRVKTVHGDVVGARGPSLHGGRISVQQTIGTVEPDSEVVGYDGRTDTARS